MQPAAQFAALADETRCRVVELLHVRPHAVHELTEAFAISRPAVSRHLRVLKEAGLVEEKRQGRENIYSLKRERLRLLSDWLTRHWMSRLEALKAVVEARTENDR